MGNNEQISTSADCSTKGEKELFHILTVNNIKSSVILNSHNFVVIAECVWAERVRVGGKSVGTKGAFIRAFACFSFLCVSRCEVRIWRRWVGKLRTKHFMVLFLFFLLATKRKEMNKKFLYSGILLLIFIAFCKAKGDNIYYVKFNHQFWCG